MAHTIQLTAADQELILKALVASFEDKQANVIRDRAKLEGTEREYVDAGRKFLQPVTCGRSGVSARDNLFGWLIDQIDHSPNVKRTQLGERAINIARACGKNEYGRYCSVTETNFNNLFH